MYNEKDLYGIAGKYVNNFGRDYPEADQEDMKQEAVIAMWQAQQKADANRNPGAYVCLTGRGTVQNTVAKVITQAERFKTTLNVNNSESEEDTTQAVDLIEGREKTFVENTLASEMSVDLFNAIEALPESQRKAFQRLEIDGLTLEAYGQEAGFSKERARQVLNDAKQSLAQALRRWESEVYAA